MLPLEPPAEAEAVLSTAPPLLPSPALAPLCKLSEPPSPSADEAPPAIETLPPVAAPLEPLLIETLPPAPSVPAAAPDESVSDPAAPLARANGNADVAGCAPPPVAMSSGPLAPLAELPVIRLSRPESPPASSASDDDKDTSPVLAASGAAAANRHRAALTQ